MKVIVKIQPYIGGVVCTILDEGHTYQLGQSSVFHESRAMEAVEGAVNHMLKCFQGKDHAATWPPKELDFAGKIKELEGEIAAQKKLLANYEALSERLEIKLADARRICTTEKIKI